MGAVAATVIGYLAVAAVAAERAGQDAQVAGIALGADPAGALREGLAERATADVPVTLDGAGGVLDPTAAGLRVDEEATVHRAVGFTLDPRLVVSRLQGQTSVAPVILVDEAGLDDELRRLSAELGTEPVDGAVSLAGGTITRTDPVVGTGVDRDAAPQAVIDQWLQQDPVVLPAADRIPDIDSTDVDELVSGFAEPATSGEVHLQVGEATVRLAPADYAPALVIEARDGALVGSVDGEALAEILVNSGQGVAAEAQDARFEFVEGTPRVVPSVAGVSIEAAPAALALEDAFAAADRTGQVPTDVVDPAVSTADLEAAGVQEPISEFATRMTGSSARRENITIAADTINGTYLAPGETFSMNEVLGPRTREKGYRGAPVIMNGRMTTGTGGGVSQVATTLFNGAYFAGLEDVEHKAHSLYISRYPVGREATVNYPNVDLKFTNDTDHGVLIRTWVGDGKVNTQFWSTKVYDITSETSGRYNYRSPRTIEDSRSSCTPQSPSSGFDVTVTRIFSQGEVEVKREKMVTSYIAANRVVCTAKE
ncbi:MAG: VanW family protein [Actinomycetales bacterium]